MTTFMGRQRMTVETLERDDFIRQFRVKATDGVLSNCAFMIDYDSDYVPKVGDDIMVSISRHVGSAPMLSVPNTKDQA